MNIKFLYLIYITASLRYIEFYLFYSFLLFVEHLLNLDYVLLGIYCYVLPVISVSCILSTLYNSIVISYNNYIYYYPSLQFYLCLPC